MPSTDEIWAPGSFTKNFSWGQPSSGLRELYHAIRLGFNGEVEDVPRQLFRDRIAGAGRPDFIPVNFFLFNKTVDGRDYIIADELVFQAINYPHSGSFDKLALFCFNLSLAGRWRGSKEFQRRPALWSNSYIRDRLSSDFDWDVKKVNSNDIEAFVTGSKKYTGKTTRKLATNLYYLYKIGRLNEFPNPRIERWWVDSLFAALDRIIEDRSIDGKSTHEDQYVSLLFHYDFVTLTGYRTLEKDLAVSHLAKLYSACGGRARFSDTSVKDRSNILIPDLSFLMPNDPRPRGAIHPTNARILKSIPPVCAMLAKYVAGFDVIGPDEVENFDLEEFVRSKTLDALQKLESDGVRPIMSSNELMQITREKK